MSEKYRIITFYEFKEMSSVGGLIDLRGAVKGLMREMGVVGTLILAEEGFNSTVAGPDAVMDRFVSGLEDVLHTKITFKASYSDAAPFRKVDVKIKPEIVTLKRPVEIVAGKGTHVPVEKWNELITSEDVILLDTRNDYEFRTGTFAGAINPETEKFSDLPEFVEKNLDAKVHKKVAMFCTGGIRCEKFAPYMKSIGFEKVYQLEGGILKYLETVPSEEHLWRGECFVFDERIAVDGKLRKGESRDLSQPLAAEESTA